MQINVPNAVADYFAADRESNAERLAACFAEDGFVHDEGQDRRGRDAIRKWKEAADAKYKYISEPLRADTDGDTVTVRARLTGNFPGRPIEVNYVFTLAGDKVRALEIRS